MRRLIFAFNNSMAGFRHLVRHEAAFKQECLLLILAVPAGYLISSSFSQFVLLLFMLVLIMLVEVINTAIEAVCDALSTEFDANIKVAKDCGSLAVFISVVMALAVWAVAIIQWLLRFG